MAAVVLRRATGLLVKHHETAARCGRRLISSLPMEDRPLTGIKVVDLTRVLAGPLATMMLSDLGADVIKIENPRGGDDTRSWQPPSAPLPAASGSKYPRPDLPAESAYFLQANRNKRSVTVDFKRKEGQEVVKKLVAQADVLVENYLPGKLDDYGLGYEQLAALNPRLVYCSVTGYGPSGPYAKQPGYDVVIEAEAGFMHITGEKGGQPVKAGVAVTDILTGHHAQSGILAALFRRERTGKGGRVECSLFETQIASLVNIGSNYLIAGQEASRWGTSHPSIVPYQVFPTADGYIMIAAGNDVQWKNLVAPSVLDRSDWRVDSRFETNQKRVENRTELIALLEVCMSERTTSEWCTRLHGKGIPFAPINNIAGTFAHPQAVAREAVEEIEHPRAGKLKLAAAPTSYDGAKLKAYRPPPYLGQHTDEVLGELGYDSAQISHLREKGAL